RRVGGGDRGLSARDLFRDALLHLLRPVQAPVGRIPGPAIWLNAVQLDIGRDAPLGLALLVRRPHEILLGRVLDRCGGARRRARKGTAIQPSNFIVVVSLRWPSQAAPHWPTTCVLD